MGRFESSTRKWEEQSAIFTDGELLANVHVVATPIKVWNTYPLNIEMFPLALTKTYKKRTEMPDSGSSCDMVRYNDCRKNTVSHTGDPPVILSIHSLPVFLNEHTIIGV